MLAARKAPEGWRSPSRGGTPRQREASWTAVVLYRLGECEKTSRAKFRPSQVLHARSGLAQSKTWRHFSITRSVLECGSPLPLCGVCSVEGRISTLRRLESRVKASEG